MEITCHCPCGKSQCQLRGPVHMRFCCHCEICQSLYRKPFADIIALKASQIVKPLDRNIRFAKYRSPPAVNRGVCADCRQPVLAFLPLAPFVGLAFIPAVNFPLEAELPEPQLHTFYDRRVEEVEDHLPKIAGYWSSQWAVANRFFTNVLLS